MNRKSMMLLLLITKYIVLIVFDNVVNYQISNNLILHYLLDVIHVTIFIIIFKNFLVEKKEVFGFRIVIFTTITYVIYSQLCDLGCFVANAIYSNSFLTGYSIAFLSCKPKRKK